VAFVLDASVAIGWFVPQQATAYTNRMRRLARKEPLHVPAVWPLEIANALCVLQRRGNLTERAARTAADLLGGLEVTLHQGKLSIPALRELAERYGLSAYDASYLDLAISLHLPLACRDSALMRALPVAGVRLA
jgi:predicted nucleic acid-binding protein